MVSLLLLLLGHSDDLPGRDALLALGIGSATTDVEFCRGDSSRQWSCKWSNLSKLLLRWQIIITLLLLLRPPSAQLLCVVCLAYASSSVPSNRMGKSIVVVGDNFAAAKQLGNVYIFQGRT